MIPSQRSDWRARSCQLGQWSIAQNLTQICHRRNPTPRSTDGHPKRDAANAFILMTDRYQPFQLRP